MTLSNPPLLFPPSLKDHFGLGCIYPLPSLPHFIDTLWTFVEVIGLVKVLNPISGYCLIFHEMSFKKLTCFLPFSTTSTKMLLDSMPNIFLTWSLGFINIHSCLWLCNVAKVIFLYFKHSASIKIVFYAHQQNLT